MDSYNTSNMIIFLLWIISSHFSLVTSKAPPCCATISSQSCRSHCLLVHGRLETIPKMQLLLAAAESCPLEEYDFWNCVTNNLPAVSHKSSWTGKACCGLAIHGECRRACKASDHKHKIMDQCSPSTESQLFECIDNQEATNHCCRKSTTTSCGLVCRAVALTGMSNTRANVALLDAHCQPTDQRVKGCMMRQWGSPQGGPLHKSISCCEQSTSPRCRSECRRVLKLHMTEEERYDHIVKACGEANLMDPLWTCFLAEKQNKEETLVSQDYAKLHCCSRASQHRCRELCTHTYRTGWSNPSQSEFEGSCSPLQPMSVSSESNMNGCLTDVDQPCQLGCSGLQFCSNFNHRPTELFRSCTREADMAAEKTFLAWRQGEINHLGLKIPVRDISQCQPEMWKAIVCALEIKPCASQQTPISLCKEDCLSILSQCVQASQLSGEQTVSSICNKLPSQLTPGACVPVEGYQVSMAEPSREVTHPCNPDPCPTDQVCMVRQRKCKHAASQECLPYVCHHSCPLGQMSKVRVPRGTAVRLANPNQKPGSWETEDCPLACTCSSKGKLEGCQPLPCHPRHACGKGSQRRDHGEQYLVGEARCICQGGQELCARRSCKPDTSNRLFTGLPGNCPTEYQPVCGYNGKVYPNKCMANCVGMTYYTCDPDNKCSHNPCPKGTACVPRPQMCLNNDKKHGCEQFQCVEASSTCSTHQHAPVCSTQGTEFSNLCVLLSKGHELAYRGHCQAWCSTVGQVCGHDGQTYASQCACRAARVTVDYLGRCKAFGNLTVAVGPGSMGPTCGRVQCLPLSPRNCQGIVPTGGCCPVCASQLTLLWDPLLMDGVAAHLEHSVSALSVLEALAAHVAVVECGLTGHVSVGGELVVLVGPVVEGEATATMVQACQTESERLHNMIRLGSPNLASYLLLSPLLPAQVDNPILLPSPTPGSQIDKHGHGPNSSGVGRSPCLVLYLFVCCVSLLIHKHGYRS